jgi:lipoprotein NlpD
MKEKIKTKIRKLRFKYKISILNENTLEETHSLRLSPLNAITLFVVLLLIVFAFYSAVSRVMRPILPPRNSSRTVRPVRS